MQVDHCKGLDTLRTFKRLEDQKAVNVAFKVRYQQEISAAIKQYMMS